MLVMGGKGRKANVDNRVITIKGREKACDDDKYGKRESEDLSMHIM